jgi:hypothetical protein
MMERGVWVREEILRNARDAVKSLRVELQGAQPWLDGDDMVSVHRIWDRTRLEEYLEHIGQLEDMLVGLLAICLPTGGNDEVL